MPKMIKVNLPKKFDSFLTNMEATKGWERLPLLLNPYEKYRIRTPDGIVSVYSNDRNQLMKMPQELFRTYATWEQLT